MTLDSKLNLFERVMAQVAKLPTTPLGWCIGTLAFCGTVALWWLFSIVHSLFGQYEFTPVTGELVWVSKVNAWEPSWAMITLVSAWGGVVVAQFAAKRSTDRLLAVAKSGRTETSTVVQDGEVTTRTTSGPNAGAGEPVGSNLNQQEDP